ncbi:MAG: VOC family protein [Acidobacteriota bacterium]|nr:VOC family protein [Acidobacteriota bacterium]
MRRRTAALLMVVLLSCLPGAIAQAPQVTGIAHIALRVSDLDRERTFFHALGFDEAFALNNGARTTEVFVKVNDRQFIEIYPRVREKDVLGWMHVCYESDSLQQLYALYAARGLRMSPVVKAGAGNLISSFHDQDGRVVEFTQYLPGSRHFEDRGKHLGALRVSDELQAIRMPVHDLAAARQFYTATLGFEELNGDAGGRMRISGDANEWIGLFEASANTQPQFLFRVANTKRAANQLRSRGLKITQQKKHVSVEDPEGNVFVFVKDSLSLSTKTRNN